MSTKTALLVIDAQNIYTNPNSGLFCPDSKATIQRINKLTTLFQEKAQPVIYIRHEHKTDGSDLGRLFDFTGTPEPDFNFKEGSDEVKFDQELLQLKSSLIVTKSRYSSFAGTNLNLELQQLGVNRVVICGFMTNFCCESTARAALDLDYYVDFIADATGTPGTETINENEMRRIVSELLSAGFARVHETDSFIDAEK